MKITFFIDFAFVTARSILVSALALLIEIQNLKNNVTF